jgi:hypothetical protein
MRRPFLRIFFRALFPCRPESPILGKCASPHWNATLDHASVYENGVIQSATVRACDIIRFSKMTGLPQLPWHAPLYRMRTCTMGDASLGVRG